MLLELLEFLTCRCTRKMHTEFNNKAFLQSINSIFNRKLLSSDIKSIGFWVWGDWGFVV